MRAKISQSSDADPRPRRGAADRGEPVGQRDPLGDGERQDQGRQPRMLADQGGEPLAAERAQDDVGDRGHRLRRIGEGEQRQAEYVALEMEAHDLAAAIAEHDAAMCSQPVRTMNSSRGALVLADDDGAAAAVAILLLEPVQRLLLAGGQPDVMAEPLS